MDRKQTNFILGLAAGGAVASTAFLVSNNTKISADEAVTGVDTKPVCDSKPVSTEVQAIITKDDSANMAAYGADIKATISKSDLATIKVDSKIIKYDGKIYDTDGKIYDSKPDVADTKVFKNDDGKYLKTDAKELVAIDMTKIDPGATLIKADENIVTKGDQIKTDGKIYNIPPVGAADAKTVICETGGVPLEFSYLANTVAVLQLRLATVDAIIPVTTTTPAATTTTPVVSTVPTTTSTAPKTTTAAKPTTATTVTPTATPVVPVIVDKNTADLVAKLAMPPEVITSDKPVSTRIKTFFSNIWKSIVSFFHF